MREPATADVYGQGARQAQTRGERIAGDDRSRKGVQIYECRVRKDQAGGYEWAFVAPDADLFSARGNRIGRHYAGPHWESNDGSQILGTVKERADAAVADAIPWLLRAATSVGSEGSFSKVTSPPAARAPSASSRSTTR